MKTGPILKIRHTERNISQPIVVCSFPNKVKAKSIRSECPVDILIIKDESFARYLEIHAVS